MKYKEFYYVIDGKQYHVNVKYNGLRQKTTYYRFHDGEFHISTNSFATFDSLKSGLDQFARSLISRSDEHKYFHDGFMFLFGDVQDPNQYFVNPDQVNTGMFNDPKYTEGYFEEISQNDLRPGDICLQERGSGTRGGVHVVMYVGQNANGDDLYIDCSQYYGGGSGDGVHGQLPGLKYDYNFGAIGVRPYTHGKVWYRYTGNK